jgi:protein phosphatase 1G
MQGWRNTMEDSHIAELDLGNGVSFFGVYDGHGGKSNYKNIWSISKPINPKLLISIGNEVADYVKEHLVSELKKMDSFINKNYRKALEDIYIKMDIDI